ncbi:MULTISPECIES: porin [unclassified Lentimonas]|uniref:porin n=1 Tax=unclassified Lentimonas TaxID=2630993 RepID=UPI00132A89AE|nr:MULTISPECIES: porin [unclassified Lentimonas]CAA6693259.1 Unannotated [Lentimonas sp. CC10]CAA6695465.1 Unannotated [Lentimonas sp. CC19]CAA7071765.1 Unannotated [Lentimonas sp. CC11]
MKRFLATACACTAVCQAQQHHNIEPVSMREDTQDATSDHSQFPIEFCVASAWDSHYVSEGRDNLDGNSLASIEATASYEGFTVGAWGAESPDQDYREYNYWLEYSYEWQAFTFTVGYTYLDFDTDKAHDNEVSFYIGYTLPCEVELEIGGYYSDENSGCFYEAILSREFEVMDQLNLLPFIQLGYNDDYIAEGHNGLNNLTLGLECNCALTEQFSIGAYVAQNIAIDADTKKHADDHLLDDFAYFGLNASYSF